MTGLGPAIVVSAPPDPDSPSAQAALDNPCNP